MILKFLEEKFYINYSAGYPAAGYPANSVTGATLMKKSFYESKWVNIETKQTKNKGTADRTEMFRHYTKLILA